MSAERIIFLDVDGVLITRETCGKGLGVVDPDCVKAVNDLITQSGAKIVLSSCWRIGRNRIECCDMLHDWGIVGTVLDRTPHESYSTTRGQEIQQWMDEYQKRREIESFVIVDDDSDMDHLLPRLVKTTFTHGFTQAHIPEALALFDPSGGER